MPVLSMVKFCAVMPDAGRRRCRDAQVILFIIIEETCLCLVPVITVRDGYYVCRMATTFRMRYRSPPTAIVNWRMIPHHDCCSDLRHV